MKQKKNAPKRNEELVHQKKQRVVEHNTSNNHEEYYGPMVKNNNKETTSELVRLHEVRVGVNIFSFIVGLIVLLFSLAIVYIGVDTLLNKVDHDVIKGYQELILDIFIILFYLLSWRQIAKFFRYLFKIDHKTRAKKELKKRKKKRNKMMKYEEKVGKGHLTRTHTKYERITK